MRIFIFILIGLCILWGNEKIHDAELVPIKKVQIVGTYFHVNKSVLQELIEPHVEKGFLNVDITTLRERLLTLPWIAEVAINRVWPYTLVIQIAEQHPIANWNQKSLLNQEGFLFSPPPESLPQNLPKLLGPEGQQEAVLNIYKKMADILAPLGFTITELEQTPRQAVQLHLSNGIELMLGREEVLTRLRHFVRVFPKIFVGKEKSVNSIDMRYPNGISVNWQSGEPNLNGKKN